VVFINACEDDGWLMLKVTDAKSTLRSGNTRRHGTCDHAILYELLCWFGKNRIAFNVGYKGG